MSEWPNLSRGTDAQGPSLDVIELRNLAVDCIVGLYPRERIAAQPLRLDVALFLDAPKAPEAGHRLPAAHDGRLAGELLFLLEACRFKVLESAAETVARYVLLPPLPEAPHAQVRAATVRVTKPHALAGLAVPSLQVHRTAEEFGAPAPTGAAAPGGMDFIHEGPGYSVYRLHLGPGCTAAHAFAPPGEQVELVLGAGLLLNGAPVARGMAFHWPGGSVRRYDNPTSTPQALLCVSLPRFFPLVEGAWPSAGAPPVQGRSYYPAGAGGPSAHR
ncbi:dihydroneopterin aldolase [Stigmatella erecta]|uniref:Dihydroneopterin aldolase n=1 Tax=Stigmatella erecta TaxID=83460 RepID=A0A1I0JVX6_9BACT|nr:dihydroneopterin aldolase [Stigmatella erecta]SEU14809.1 dihydroneopterin aldolase [Stigmatella erecta]